MITICIKNPNINYLITDQTGQSQLLFIECVFSTPKCAYKLYPIPIQTVDCELCPGKY